MKPTLRHVGVAQTPVVAVDEFTGAVEEGVELAASLAPFPPSAGNYYPGLRRPILAQTPAFAYIEQLLEQAAPLIGGAFDAERFDLLEASFSMVTTPAATLAPPQRAPHFDSTDPDHLAVMLYLRDTPGTAFFRQNATGIEVVNSGNVDAFVAAAKRTAPAMRDYISGSGPHYRELGRVEGYRDRLTIYPGALLHSGLISAGEPLSDDPRIGRLTANIFIRIFRSSERYVRPDTPLISRRA
ncbi:DUF6445 family protein [Sphingomonas sp.]|jgi:hypothetical protein|uniref:DUF6445 family protein n=1 Tax=Sphingomonas sp. TaxID=28214 RepID=UPI002E3004A1|nr:DUF6445 family protein [Sphingomonas sp.]HEX4695619.1 DUF6445 family protein [Sphingomonas sp.]